MIFCKNKNSGGFRAACFLRRAQKSDSPKTGFAGFRCALHSRQNAGNGQGPALPILAAFLLLASVFLLNGCRNVRTQENAITVSLWSTVLLEDFAPYIQSRLPDIKINFVAGNNTLEYYDFLNKNGELPDIITCRRFSLHDASPLKDSLIDLSTTEAAGSVYESYLSSFTNDDGSINWLPLCGVLDGFVANRALFEKYSIPLPHDWESFVSACRAFEKNGIRGFASDFAYDYTCMEILQGLSISEINSIEGTVWRQKYAGCMDNSVGLDDVWKKAFFNMEQFIEDTGLLPSDLKLGYDEVINMFMEGKTAIIRTGGSNAVVFQKNGMDAVFLPYFCKNGEQWILSYPEFQVALNKNLEKDEKRLKNAMKVLSVMLSEESQNTLAKGDDAVSYSQNVRLIRSPHLSNLEPLVKKNHVYIRIASNDFFAVSKEVVSKMIKKEYGAERAFFEFDRLLKTKDVKEEKPILVQDRSQQNVFYKTGGNQSFSAMANSLRHLYKTEVLIAPSYSFTGTVLNASYGEKQAGWMIMPNALESYSAELTGKELFECLKILVEGAAALGNKAEYKNIPFPFNDYSLPCVSGISIEVKNTGGKYCLEDIFYGGKKINMNDTFTVTLLNPKKYMTPFFDRDLAFKKGEKRVKDVWVEYIKNGGILLEGGKYITLK